MSSPEQGERGRGNGPGCRSWAILAALAGAAAVMYVALSCRAQDGQGPAPPPAAEQPRPAADDPYYAPRKAMVDALREYFPLPVTDERVLQAMLDTPRHLFVPEDVRDLAYIQSPLPIGEGQTISAPYIVGLMTEKLKPDPEDVILEIGTGSGYQAAVLAPLVKQVYTIEIVPSLAETATVRLQEMGYGNVTVRCGDGYQGWPEQAPFDGIMVTCAPTHPPQPLVDQLRDGGRLVIPYGEENEQELYVLVKAGTEVREEEVLAVAFVPMTGEAQQQNQPTEQTP